MNCFKIFPIILFGLISVITMPVFADDLFISGGGSNVRPGETSREAWEQPDNAAWHGAIGIYIPEKDFFKEGKSTPFERYNHIDEFYFSLSMHQDAFSLKDEFATNLGVDPDTSFSFRSYLLAGEYDTHLLKIGDVALSATYGGGLGVSRTQLSDSAWQTMDNTTFSGLRSENSGYNFTRAEGFGASISWMGNIRISYSYDRVSIDKNYAFWHDFLSRCIYFMIFTPPIAISDMSVSEKTGTSYPYKLFRLAWAMGSLAAIHYADDREHNWPFNDNDPLLYNRHRISVTLIF